MENFDFIDLFSGIGGFHQAMTQLGGHCVLASEIDPFCNVLYKKNYGISSDVNIRDLNEKTDVPNHQVLCGGFPCQSFSKAGKQAPQNTQQKTSQKTTKTSKQKIYSNKYYDTTKKTIF